MAVLAMATFQPNASAKVPDWVRKAKGFQGTFTFRVNVSGSGASDLITSSKWSILKEVTGKVVLDRWDEQHEAWTGTVEGTGTFNHEFVDTIPGCTNKMTVKGTKPLVKMPEAQPIQPYLYFNEDGTYYLQIDYALVAVNSVTHGVCDFGSDTTVMDVSEGFYPNVYISKPWPAIPAEPGGLRLSRRLMDEFSVQWLILFDGPELALEFPADLTWDLRPIGMEEEELDVVVSDSFESFRPKAAAGGGRGDGLALTAKLRNKNGGEINDKARRFRWNFTQVSREPGFALNAPLSSPGKEPDFSFEPGGNVKVLGDERLAAETDEGEYTESTAQIGSYDWGAYGRVRVTAVLQSGKELVGYLEGDPSQTEIRLPKRRDGDLIAKTWRDAKGVGSRSDSADDEDKPFGDGNAGDGFSLYEEYRGFYENGVHIEGDPFAKDLFILNLAGSSMVPGVRMFAGLTGLNVHDRITTGEIPRDRVMNVNHASAHRVDQHGLRIVPDSTIQGYAEARGGPGSPGMISEIAMPAFSGRERPEEVSYFNTTLVHELLHAVNVYHHGEKPELHVVWSGNSVDGYKENSGGRIRPIRILNENGSLYTRDLGAGRSIILGQYESPYSGVDTCVMKYDAAQGYLSISDSDVRYRANETPGSGICSDTQGTGVNAPERQPQSRFGPAAAGRGNCKGQILVNDAVRAPRR